MEATLSGACTWRSVVRVFAVFVLFVHDVCGDQVSVMEADSLTLHTGVKTDPKYGIKWYFGDIRIAFMHESKHFISKEERFAKRLKVDANTTDLTITDVRAADAGVYKLFMNTDLYKTFNVKVNISGVSAPDHGGIVIQLVSEGDSVTLDPVVNSERKGIEWYFNAELIAAIIGDSSRTCTDNRRFRDRLKVDKHTGALTITDTRTTDSGLYTLQIIFSSENFSISTKRKFGVNVSDSRPSSDMVMGATVFVLLVSGIMLTIFGFMYRHKHRKTKNNKSSSAVEYRKQSLPSNKNTADGERSRLDAWRESEPDQNKLLSRQDKFTDSDIAINLSLIM